jgi:hypothetical protein
MKCKSPFCGGVFQEEPKKHYLYCSDFCREQTRFAVFRGNSVYCTKNDGEIREIVIQRKECARRFCERKRTETIVV